LRQATTLQDAEEVVFATGSYQGATSVVPISSLFLSLSGAEEVENAKTLYAADFLLLAKVPH